MSNDKKSMIVMMVVTIAVVGVCAGIIIFKNNATSEPEKAKVMTDKKVIPIVKKKKKEAEKSVSIVSTTVDAKKDENAENRKEAFKELNNFLKNSKFKELMMNRMTSRNKSRLKDLFEKYGIDEESQDIIASAITESRSEMMGLVMQGGFGQEQSEESRTEMAEKLTAINQEKEDRIKEASSEAFLADVKDKQSTDSINRSLSRIDRSLGDDKMSDDQKTEMDNLYRENQVTQLERLTLSPDEIQQRDDNMKNGAKDILSEDQYQNYNKSSRFSMPGGMGGMGRGMR